MVGRHNVVVLGKNAINVHIYPLQRSESSPFKQGCPDCHELVGRKEVCKGCGREGTRSDWLQVFPTGNDDKIVLSREQSAEIKKLDKGIIVAGIEPIENIDKRRITSSMAIDPVKDKKKLPFQDQNDSGLKKHQSQWKQIQQGLEKANVALTVEYNDTSEKVGSIVSEHGRLVLYLMVHDSHFNNFEELPDITVEKSRVEAAAKGIKGLQQKSPSELPNRKNEKIQKQLENPQEIVLETPSSKSQDDSLEF